jgi:hypothetical protein
MDIQHERAGIGGRMERMENEEQQAVALTPEAQELLKRLVQERDAAIGRLDMAIVAMKAALGVPLDWQIQNIEQGFVRVEASDGGNN